MAKILKLSDTANSNSLKIMLRELFEANIQYIKGIRTVGSVL